MPVFLILGHHFLEFLVYDFNVLVMLLGHAKRGLALFLISRERVRFVFR